MKVSEMAEKPREQRDPRTGEIIPACTGRQHWWYIVHQSGLMKCKHCNAVKFKG